MAHEYLSIPDEVPAELYAGDSLYFHWSDGDHPASDGWTLSFILNGPGQLTKAGAANAELPDRFDVEIDSTDTADLPAGTYSWVVTVTKSSQRHVVESGSISVLADPATLSGATEQRSHARQMLAQIETLMLARTDVLSFSLFGRSYSYESRAELRNAYAYWLRRVRAEDEAARRAKGKPSRSLLTPHFGDR